VGKNRAMEAGSAKWVLVFSFRLPCRHDKNVSFFRT